MEVCEGCMGILARIFSIPKAQIFLLKLILIGQNNNNFLIIIIYFVFNTFIINFSN